jgi:hypothetical protein
VVSPFQREKIRQKGRLVARGLQRDVVYIC